MKIKSNKLLWVLMALSTTSISVHAETFSFSENMLINQELLQGKVLGKDGEPLVGATVINQRTKVSSQTNSIGDFSIEAIKGDLLSVSYIGYATLTYKISYT